MLILTFLLFEARGRSKLPPYSSDSNDEENVVLPQYAIDMEKCMFLFLWVAFLCMILVVYCLYTVPKKRALLQTYMSEGISMTGDVFYPEDQTCYGLNAQFGTVTYEHPNTDHAYVRRSVRLFQNFSQEWVSILVLPSSPYSGHPKSDMEMAYLAGERQRSAMKFLAGYSVVWFLGNLASALYILLIVKSNKYEDEFPRGWLWFGICVVLMPFAGLGINYLIFQRYMKWMTTGDAKVLQGNDRALKQMSSNNKNNVGPDGTYRKMPEDVGNEGQNKFRLSSLA